MKKIPLYEGKRGGSESDKKFSGKYAVVDDEDYDYLSKYQWFLMKIYHTDNSIFYARRYEGLTRLGTYKAILMHREVLGLVNKKDKGDHKDGDGLNNQKCNLRKATHSENLINRHYRTPEKKSIYNGVYCVDGKWAYVLRHQKKIHQRSGFVSEDVAALEYNKKSIEIKGDDAPLNIIRWQ